VDGGALPVRCEGIALSVHLLERSQTLAGEPEELFAFYRDPFNLERITPRWMRFRVIGSSHPYVRRGTRIEYELRWHRFPLHWVTLIEEYEDGVGFVDVMERGPYRRWRHEHRFTPTKGGLQIDDRVEYELPGGVLGEIVHRLVVRRQLEEIFDHRAARMHELFGGPPRADADTQGNLPGRLPP
jgi:ligand-binding SRPBCC domain-containing protein